MGLKLKLWLIYFLPKEHIISLEICVVCYNSKVLLYICYLLPLNDDCIIVILPLACDEN